VGGTGQEIEVKFYVHNLEPLISRLQDIGCKLVEPRVHEVNLRFDTPDRALTSARRVLRLRKDRQIHLTYKGPGIDEDGVRRRQEVEITVSSFETAKAFLEALGYEVSFIYEKHRTTFSLDDIIISLDETPFGKFIEIEGPSPDSIRQSALNLSLDWEARILHSYIYLFDQVCRVLGLKFRDLTIENFKNLNVSGEDLGVKPAD
jgi:adenylate cyclase, class 2